MQPQLLPPYFLAGIELPENSQNLHRLPGYAKKLGKFIAALISERIRTWKLLPTV
jgi:hypothetical protein